jgi:hypothetical protein
MNITVRSMPQVRHDKYLGVLGNAPKSHPTAAFSEICHPTRKELVQASSSPFVYLEGHLHCL